MDLRWLRLALTFAVALAFAGSIGGVYSYNRPPMRKDLIVRHLEDLDDSSPQQVFINFMPSYIDVYMFGNSCFQYMNLLLKIMKTKFCGYQYNYPLVVYLLRGLLCCMKYSQ